MNETLLTVDQVAVRLELHPKTVRRFIRAGRLAAHKMGGQWRVTEQAVRRFSRGEGAPDNASAAGEQELLGQQHRPADLAGGKVQVSAVVDIAVAGRDEADRLSATMVAVMNTGDPLLRGARLKFFYYDRDKRARFLLWGCAGFVGRMLEMFSELSVI